MSRIHNFSAGPAVLPLPVLQQASRDILEVQGTGLGILECSHRSAMFDEVIGGAISRLRSLLNLDDDQEVLFLHGGARTQFYQWPMNVLGGGRAAYLDTGNWARFAAEDAARYGQVDTLFSSQDTGYDRVPEQGSISVPSDALYLHYTSNNTVAGTQFDYVPDPGKSWLACDMSSDFLSRPVDGSKFDYLYAGAQKNVGPSGTTVVILRRRVLERCSEDLPRMLQYPVQVSKSSMLNTPCTFSIYVVSLVTKWIEERGGLGAIDAHNRAQAGKVYGAIDGSGFYSGKVSVGSRSLMNITFTTGDADLDTAFWKTAADEGISGLKGHRSVGGLRASIYNAQTDEAIDALVGFMAEFERRRG